MKIPFKKSSNELSLSCDLCDADQSWNMAYHYYLNHRFCGLPKLSPLLSLLSTICGISLHVSTASRLATASARELIALQGNLPAMAIAIASLYAAGIALFIFGFFQRRSAQIFACDAADCENYSLRDIAIFYRSLYSA